MITLKLPVELKKAIEETAAKRFMSMSGYLKMAAQRQLLEDGVDWQAAVKKPNKSSKK